MSRRTAVPQSAVATTPGQRWSPCRAQRGSGFGSCRDPARGARRAYLPVDGTVLDGALRARRCATTWVPLGWGRPEATQADKRAGAETTLCVEHRLGALTGDPWICMTV